MGRAVSIEKVKDTPRHPSPRSPLPGPPVFLDARDKDLPFVGISKHPRDPESSYFDQPLGLREEGALLLAVLTGVQGSPLQKIAPGMPGFSLLYGVGSHDGVNESPRNKKGAKKGLRLDLRMDVPAGLNANILSKKFQKLQQCLDPVDVAVDTDDLAELTADKTEESGNWLFETAEEEELFKYTQELDQKAGTGREVSLKDYIALVKKSAGRLGVRTQMLHDLSLGEDVDLGVTDLPATPPPPTPTPTPNQKAANPDEKEKPKTGKDPYVGAMCATSLVVKKARRLAGLMHTEQQTLDLREVYDWLQHLGDIAPPENGKDDDLKSDASGNKGTFDGHKGDWRLPSSPAMALLYAQEDLRQRLAHLYQEKNTLENRKEQLHAAKRLVGKVGDAEEAKLLNYIRGLQTLEEGYETLGGKIADNLDDASNLDKRFQSLTEKAEEDNKGTKGKASEKKSKKGKKKGKKSKKEEGEGDGEEEESKGADTGRDSEVEKKSESEGSDGEAKGKKRKKKILIAEIIDKIPDMENRATSPVTSSLPGSDKNLSTQDQAAQTDDAALFSLMESMFNDMVDEAPVGPEDEATELRRLRREMKKLQVQLRFWRSRNWVEQHQHLLSSNSSSPSFTLPVDASPSEAGFAFYFDSLRVPVAGSYDVVRAPTHGSAPSNLNSRPIGLSKLSAGPSSAPSTFPSRAVAPTPAPISDHVRQPPVAIASPMAGLRLSQVEAARPNNPLNLRLMSNAPRSSRASRGWSVRPQEAPPAFPPNALVIFGRSSTLQTPRESTPALPHCGSITPRRSGMQHQKA